MISASVLAPVALLCVWLGGVAYVLLIAAAFGGVIYEWGAMCRWKPLPFVLGVLYAVIAAFGLVILRLLLGADAVFFVLILVWGTDIGAYVVGRLVGGRRLAPRISPGKTWSGAVGGFLTSVLISVALGGLYGWFSVLAIGIAALVSVAAQLGDLAESAAKRHYGVKDSGWLIPGHGGVLDRLDGLMAASVALVALVAATLPFLDLHGLAGL